MGARGGACGGLWGPVGACGRLWGPVGVSRLRLLPGKKMVQQTGSKSNQE